MLSQTTHMPDERHNLSAACYSCLFYNYVIFLLYTPIHKKQNTNDYEY